MPGGPPLDVGRASAARFGPSKDLPSAVGVAARRHFVVAGVDRDGRGLAVAGPGDDLAIEAPGDDGVIDADRDEAQVLRFVEHRMNNEDRHEQQVHAITVKLVPYVPAGNGVGMSRSRSLRSRASPGCRVGSGVSGPW